jgi:hypothetical protein
VRAIGLDVHRDFCEIAIAEAGSVRSAGRIATRPEVLEVFAESLASTDQVVLEVTGNAWEIARIIEAHVARVVVVSPSDTGIRQARAKTDRLDALAVGQAAGGRVAGHGLDARRAGPRDAPTTGPTLSAGQRAVRAHRRAAAREAAAPRGAHDRRRSAARIYRAIVHSS